MSMNADSEQLRVLYEGVIKHNPSNVEAVHYLATWHLERHSFQQARKYFGHLATLRPTDTEVWLCLGVCCAMAEEFVECCAALKTVQELTPNYENDVRLKFCKALVAEKRKDFTTAMEGYVACLNQCATQVSARSNNHNSNSSSSNSNDGDNSGNIGFLKELRGEVMLRIAVLKKDMGAIDQSMQMCNTITGPAEHFGAAIRANTLCLKGLLHEIRTEFPASEVVYRSVLQIAGGHAIALERLGRVYLRYRETIPAAVQCFFKSVETNPSNHTAWYLLGRCYMATSQYADACEAYNRAANLNPNDPQVWCSLGVLYYAFGQYREALGMLARALKLDPNMADAWYNVGALYDMCDQPEDAQQAYLKAKQNGLADRFARAGKGMNAVAMQSLQFISSTDNTGAITAGATTASTIADNTAVAAATNAIATGATPAAAITTSTAVHSSAGSYHLPSQQQSTSSVYASALISSALMPGQIPHVGSHPNITLSHSPVLPTSSSSSSSSAHQYSLPQHQQQQQKQQQVQLQQQPYHQHHQLQQPQQQWSTFEQQQQQQQLQQLQQLQQQQQQLMDIHFPHSSLFSTHGIDLQHDSEHFQLDDMDLSNLLPSSTFNNDDSLHQHLHFGDGHNSSHNSSSSSSSGTSDGGMPDITSGVINSSATSGFNNSRNDSDM